MSAVATNHAAQRPLKAALFDRIHAEIRATRGHVWSHACREESVIVGQLGGRPIFVAVKLPGRLPPDRVLATIVNAHLAGGIALIARQPGDFTFHLKAWPGRKERSGA